MLYYGIRKNVQDPAILCMYGIVTILCSVGCIMLYYATGGSWFPWAFKQVTICLCFGLLTVIISFIKSEIFYRNAYYVYGICIILLLIVTSIGHTAMGAQRWMKIGFFNIQPSELTKLSVILALSRYFSCIQHDGITKIWNLMIPCLLVSIPVCIILLQPNLGTALIIICIAGTIFFATGVKLRIFVVILVLLIPCIPLGWKYGLHDYQKQRIIMLLDLSYDPFGSGYNVAQSKIAIGSGGSTGKGIAHGTQNKLNFLPEKHNDFIGSILAEETGFFGISVLILLYAALLLLFYYFAISSLSHYESLVMIGISSMFFMHVFVNLSMISGILPVVGTPLPFLSYGGSHLSTSLIAIGIALSIRRSTTKKSFISRD